MNARTMDRDARAAGDARSTPSRTDRADDYGHLTEPATLTIRRVLPGPVDRVWAYLTDGELRRQWLASGSMEPKVGAAFELTWHNDALTDPPGARPPSFGAEHSMASRVVEFDPPKRLAFTWGEGAVTFDLEPQDDRVLLTVTHTRLRDRGMTLMVGAGWHAHLDILRAKLRGETPAPFWDQWTRLRDEYDRRVPA